MVQYLTVGTRFGPPLITPMGYGKSDAVADNSTSSGRAQNRRVGKDDHESRSEAAAAADVFSPRHGWRVRLPAERQVKNSSPLIRAATLRIFV